MTNEPLTPTMMLISLALSAAPLFSFINNNNGAAGNADFIIIKN